MKRTAIFCTIAAVIATAPSTLLLADSSGVMPFIAGSASGKGSRMYVAGAGAYKQIEVDVARLAEKVLTDAKVNQVEDRDYVKAAVLELHNAYVEYANALIADQILAMDTAGIAGNSIQLKDFMKNTAELKVKAQTFQSLLVKNESINKEVLPSNYSVIADSEGRTQAIPTVGLINLQPVRAKYENLIKTQLEPQLASYSHIKIDVNGQVLTFKDYKSILTPDFSKAPDLSPTKRAELTTQLEDLRKQSRKVTYQERIDFSDVLRTEYNDFSRRYGSDYKYVYRPGQSTSKPQEKGWLDMAGEALFGNNDSRTKLGKGNTVAAGGVSVESEFVARDNAFKRLTDVFWTRSYMRLTQGLQICAVQPKMVKATNFGAFQAIESLKQLNTTPACSKNELEDALENARRILVYSGVQADKVFDKENGFLQAGLLNKLGSAVTFTLGNRASAEALNMLIQLVYADIQEELILATPGQGLRALRQLYTARYQSNPEIKTYYSDLKCSYDTGIEGCDTEDAFAETASVGIEDNDVRSTFLALKTKNALAKDLIDQANLINEALEVARENSASHNKAKKRSVDL